MLKVKLNQRIAIQQQTTQQDAFGQPLATWSTAYTCWASIDIQNSQLIYSTEEFISKAIYRIVIRWTADVNFNAGDRIRCVDAAKGLTHTYEIEAVTNTGTANRQLMFLAYELEGEA